MSVLNHPLIGERYFFPRKDAPPAITWVDCEGARLACADLSLALRPLLLHFHGNGEVVSDYVPGFAEALRKRGIGSFFAEYRGYGSSSGTPALGAMLDDVSAIVRATGRDPSEIFVYGRSVGSIFAIEAARCFPALAGVILESGIADVYERLRLRVSPEELGVDEGTFIREVSARIDHQRVLGQYAGPTLVLHALQDHMVDVRHAERNASWALRCTKVIFERGDHNSILAYNEPAILDAVAALAGV